MSKKNDQAIDHSLFPFDIYDGQEPFESHVIVTELKREPFGHERIIGIVPIHSKYRPNLQLTESANKPEEKHVK